MLLKTVATSHKWHLQSPVIHLIQHLMPEKRDADVEYFDSIETVLSSHIGSINLMDPVSVRKAHEELMKQARNEAIHIGNKLKKNN